MRPRLWLLTLAWAAAMAAPAIAEDLVVIVHPERSADLTPAQLAQIYLKQRSFWPQGDRIVPVNRESESRERELFSSAIFKADAEELRIYWHRKYFSGVLPPPTLASGRAVREFVANDPQAIGYIRVGELDDSVRVVTRVRTGRGGNR